MTQTTSEWFRSLPLRDRKRTLAVLHLSRSNLEEQGYPAYIPLLEQLLQHFDDEHHDEKELEAIDGQG